MLLMEYNSEGEREMQQHFDVQCNKKNLPYRPVALRELTRGD